MKNTIPDLGFSYPALVQEYCRQRPGAMSPFQFINRGGDSNNGSDDLLDESSDDEHNLSEENENSYKSNGGKGEHFTPGNSYRGRPIQPTKLAEDLAKNFKKWQTVFIVEPTCFPCIQDLFC